MATPNYSFEKRQRELAKKRKTEEKRQKKAHKPDGSAASEEPASGQGDLSNNPATDSDAQGAS